MLRKIPTGQWSCYALLFTNLTVEPQGSVISKWFVSAAALFSEMAGKVDYSENKPDSSLHMRQTTSKSFVSGTAISAGAACW